jgi:uncharacterized protein (TIGR02444 family)
MADSSEEVEGALWEFSLAFYALPGVAQALIVLQDRDGLDVNLILFALWLGLSGHVPLDGDALAAADRAVSTIRSEVVEPLRTLRRGLKGNPDAGIQNLREDAKGLELAAEKLVQSRLARFARRCDGDVSRDARLAAAYANLGLYLGSERLDAAEAAVIRKAAEVFEAAAASTVHGLPLRGFDRSARCSSAEGSPHRLTPSVSRSKRSRTRPKV